MAQVSRAYRDHLYADELAGKAPERARIHRRHGFLASGGGGGSGGAPTSEGADGATDAPARRHRRPAPVRPLSPDPRGVLRAINEYELMRAFGGWWQLTGEHPDVATIARMQLVMAGIGDAERRMHDEAAGEHGGSGGGTAAAPVPGIRSEHRDTISTARSQYTKKTPVVRGPDPLAAAG